MATAHGRLSGRLGLKRLTEPWDLASWHETVAAQEQISEIPTLSSSSDHSDFAQAVDSLDPQFCVHAFVWISEKGTHYCILPNFQSIQQHVVTQAQTTSSAASAGALQHFFIQVDLSTGMMPQQLRIRVPSSAASHAQLEQHNAVAARLVRQLAAQGSDEQAKEVRIPLHICMML